MPSRIVVTTVLALMMIAGVRAQEHLTVVGCLTASDSPNSAPFRLTSATIAESQARTRGSNSAKSSTPVGGGQMSPASTGSGSTTPKGSTPVKLAMAVGEALVATSGSTTAKASAPLARKASTYDLDGEASEFSGLAGRTVEVSGWETAAPSGAAPVLRVERVSSLSPGCASR